MVIIDLTFGLCVPPEEVDLGPMWNLSHACIICAIAPLVGHPEPTRHESTDGLVGHVAGSRVGHGGDSLYG
jgi:hypothetical protein